MKETNQFLKDYTKISIPIIISMCEVCVNVTWTYGHLIIGPICKLVEDMGESEGGGRFLKPGGISPDGKIRRNPLP